MNTSTSEAMVAAKPVIAFDCGNTEDEMIRHMETGMLAESGNVYDLANNMMLLYQDSELRTRIGENAKEFILHNRGWEKRIVSDLDVYNRVLREGMKND